MKAGWIAVLLLVLGGCATGHGEIEPETTADEPAWPLTGSAVRIRMVSDFSDYEELGYRRPMRQRIRDALGGRDEQSFVRPYSISLDSGTMVIADPGAGRVHVFDRKTHLYRQVDRAGDDPFSSPVGVALGGGRIFVSDSALNDVFIFDDDLGLTGRIEGLDRPTMMAWNEGRAELYVAETNAHRIVVFDAKGDRLRTIGGRGEAPGQFNYPTHLAVSNGNLYVNDTMNFRLQVLSPDGSVVAVFGEHGDQEGYFGQAKGVGVDSQGHVYVAESVGSRVQIFDLAGQYLMGFGRYGRMPGEFVLPAGIAVSEDRIYVCDSHNGRIQVFEYVQER